MNLYSLLEELDRIYEEEAQSDIIELEDEVIEIEDEEDDEDESSEDEFVEEESAKDDHPVEEPVEITDYVLECANCGAVCIKTNKDIKTEENVDLVNVGEACDFCEATTGYILRGGLVDAPAFHQETTDELAVEESEESEELEDSMSECLTEGKIADSLKKLATRLGADAATTIRALTELIPGDGAIYDAAVHLENKAVLKALQSGNETVLNTLTKDDIEELKQDIENYNKAAKSSESEEAEDAEA